MSHTKINAQRLWDTFAETSTATGMELHQDWNQRREQTDVTQETFEKSVLVLELFLSIEFLFNWIFFTIQTIGKMLFLYAKQKKDRLLEQQKRDL